MTSKAFLRKAALVQGKSLSFRNVVVNDAEFILSLRTDAEKSRYLSSVTGALSDQQAWLHRYSQKEDQVYFIIDYMGEPIGTVRLYDPQGASFCWGSWVLSDKRPSHAAIESALMVYSYALDHLGFEKAHFDVRKGNIRVWQFHERFGALRVEESEMDFFYQIDRAAINVSRKRYHRYLNESVGVSYLQVCNPI
jgi:RimJ/RimL family protein N-acetyltransferase